MDDSEVVRDRVANSDVLAPSKYKILIFNRKFIHYYFESSFI